MGNEYFIKQLPASVEAEKSFLASCILDSDCLSEAVDLLSPEDFYLEHHQRVFAAIQESFSGTSGKAVDLALLTAKLKQSAKFDDAASFLMTIITDFPIAVSLEETAKTIRNKSAMRKAIEVYHSGIMACVSANGNAPEVLDTVQQKILAIDASLRTDTGMVPMSDLVSNAVARYEAAATHGVSGTSSGYRDLDYIIGGFQPADLIILAARPAMGKTALALNLAYNVAKRGTPVIFYSLEMTQDQLTDRLVSSRTGVSSMRLRSGQLSQDEWVAVNWAADEIHDMPIIIDDTPCLHYSEFRRRSRIAKKKHDVGMVFIDYVGLMTGNQKNGRVEEVSSITRALKMTAKEIEAPIIALSQLNRNLELRSDKKPKLSDLRESGSLEQDADIVFLLYREVVYDNDTKEPNISELEVAKHRNGPCGTVRLFFDKLTTTFKNLKREV